MERGLAIGGVIFALLLAMPFVLPLVGAEYLSGLLIKAMLLAVAAISLDLIVGHGGMVSLGHAGFVAVGAYATAIGLESGIEEILVLLAITLAASASIAVVTGILALRTSGVYFLMITLAFGQMIYFTLTSLASYGGDDGLRMWSRSTVAGLPLIESDRVFYWLCLGAAASTWWGLSALGRSAFGRALEAARLNEARALALGFEVPRIQRRAYALAGALGGLSGVLLAEHVLFVSPAYMSWHRSGELIIMVVLGGFSSLTGAGLGAVLVVLLEEALGQLTLHWRILFGAAVLAVALFARDGLAGAVRRWRGR